MSIPYIVYIYYTFKTINKKHSNYLINIVFNYSKSSLLSSKTNCRFYSFSNHFGNCLLGIVVQQNYYYFFAE